MRTMSRYLRGMESANSNYVIIPLGNFLCLYETFRFHLFQKLAKFLVACPFNIKVFTTGTAGQDVCPKKVYIYIIIRYSILK